MANLVKWDASNSRYKEVEVVTVPDGTYTGAAVTLADQRLGWLVKYGRTVIITDIGL